MEKNLADYIPDDAPLLMKAAIFFVVGFLALFFMVIKTCLYALAVAVGVFVGLYVFGHLSDNLTPETTFKTSSGVFLSGGDEADVADTVPELEKIPLWDGGANDRK